MFSVTLAELWPIGCRIAQYEIISLGQRSRRRATQVTDISHWVPPHEPQHPLIPVRRYPQDGVNSAALASLILALSGIFPTMGLTSLPAIVCGHIARRKIRATGERGTELAVTGLILGYLGLIGWVVFFGLFCLLMYNM
ncbi:hypothetical protein GCM10023194_18920 [Planotetraspora phitsanulokensis]|uniref:DUF4190 domain-containing protein n=1 Tax=Planotetraspora phitsanulokensis TaxID=575192 RepID=A0A8J3U7H2_9ACTN|nr:DUF4190 domain-containing protein [Planotetraspora phitsanulokensis]GII39476.1 hypothetical protein Pph01_44790 [Planotetraspora phitsanulokensis]